MSSRREFLVASAGAPALHAATSPVQRVDVQSHLFVPQMLDWMEQRQAAPRSFRKDGERYVVVQKWVRRVLPKHTDPAAKLAEMDAAGIAMAAISINDPGPELFGADGLRVARMAHDYLGGLIRAHPSRFFGLATLPLQDMDASLAELERCVNRLGFRGILLYSNLDGHWPDEPRYRPLFRRAVELDIPILLHPAYPMTYDATAGYDLWGSIGLMTDTSIALCRLILSGILDEFPKLKLVCPHAGGVAPYLIGRIDHQTMVLKRGAERINRPPSEYLRMIWLDCVSPFPPAIRYAWEFVGPDRLMYGSDHPWVDPKLIAECVTKLGLAPADERKIFYENARRLFRL